MSDTSEIWTIIGAGIGGKGLAAQLGIDGFRLRIHDINEAQVAGIRSAGGLHVEGREKNFAPIEMATTNIAEAVTGADVILVSTYGTAHADVAKQVAPLLVDGQTIILIQGHFAGAKLFRTELDRCGCKARIDVAEMDSYPYLLQVKSSDRVIMTTVKSKWNIVAMPASRTPHVFERVGHAFPGLVIAENLLHTGFMGLGPLFHVAGMVTNVGLVEGPADYNFYASCMVPSVCGLVENMDAERVAVAKAFGAPIIDIREWLATTYQLDNLTLMENLQEMAVTHFKYAPAPKSLMHRYLGQDVTCGIVPISCFGTAAGIPTPACDAIIGFAGVLAGRDFMAEGRNMKRLGLEGRTIAQIIDDVS